MIYPVQARPVNRPDLIPTYLDVQRALALDSSPIIQTVKGDPIVAGKASVIMLTDKSQLLFADTLEEAERQFRKDVHRIVITAKSDSANSHPVVNFSGLGMPCLHIKSLEQAKALSDQIAAGKPIAACIQSGSLHLWDAAKADPNDFVSKGFTVHPAKVALSLPLSISLPPVTQSTPPQEIVDLVVRLRAATTQKVAKEILSTLAEHTTVAKTRAEELSIRITALPYPVAAASGYIQVLKETSAQAARAINEMQATATQGRLEKLFHAKVIEAAFTATEGGLSSYTLADTAALSTAAERLIAYQRNFPFAAYFSDELMLGVQAAPFDGLADAWQHFLFDLEFLTHNGHLSKFQLVKWF